MGFIKKLFRKAVRTADESIVRKVLPHVKPEDLLPDTVENEKVSFELSFEAKIGGDIKDLYEYSSLPDDMGDDFAQDMNDTALMLGARTNNTPIFRMLLTIPGMDNVINAQNPSNETALLVAVKEGQIETVLTLLQQPNVDVNLKDKTNDTALTIAARKGITEVVEALLKHPAVYVNAANEAGETALICAAREGHTETVAALLAHPYIDPNAFTVGYNDTALMWAARNNHAPTFLHLLAHPSTEATIVNKDGQTALDLATTEELGLVRKVFYKGSIPAGMGKSWLSFASDHHRLLKHLSDFDEGELQLTMSLDKVRKEATAARLEAAQGASESLFQREGAERLETTLASTQQEITFALSSTAKMALLQAETGSLDEKDKYPLDLSSSDFQSEHSEEFASHMPQESFRLAQKDPDSVVLDKRRRKHATVAHPPQNVLLVQSAGPTGYEQWRKQLPLSVQPFLYPTADVYVSSAITALVCFATFYLVSRLLTKKPRARAARISATTGAFDSAGSPGHGEFSTKEGPRPVKFPVERDPCCPFCPEVSLIAIHNRHIHCLQVGIVECGPHDDACTLACRSNLVEYLKVLHAYNAPWGEESTRAAATQGHTEVLRFAVSKDCPCSDDIVHCAARAGHLACLQYLILEGPRVFDLDESVFGSAFERAHLECLVFLVNQGCHYERYAFVGTDMWPAIVRYRTEDPTYDARLALCIDFSIGHNNNWARDNNLAAFLDAHRLTFPLCVARIQAAEWIA